jgi:hypothetical protein
LPEVAKGRQLSGNNWQHMRCFDRAVAIVSPTSVLMKERIRMHRAHCSTALPLTGLLVRDGFKHRLRHLLDFKKSAVALKPAPKEKSTTNRIERY